MVDGELATNTVQHIAAECGFAWMVGEAGFLDLEAELVGELRVLVDTAGDEVEELRVGNRSHRQVDAAEGQCFDHCRVVGEVAQRLLDDPTIDGGGEVMALGHRHEGGGARPEAFLVFERQ